jgi:hypothetical protein
VDSYVDVSPTPLDLDSSPMEIFGHAARWWVCTTFIVFARPVFERVFPLTRFDEIDRVYFDAYTGEAFRPDCGLNQTYREFLVAHQARVWYRKYELNAENYDLFRSKTAMIINEQLIGVRIAEAGARCIDLKALEQPPGPRDKWIRRIPSATVRFLNLVRISRRNLAGRIRRSAEKLAAR